MLVARVDGLGTGELKQLAQETVRTLGSGVVVLVGAADGKAAIAVAVSKDVVARGASADAIAKPAVAKLGGGVGQGRRGRRRRRSERRRHRRRARGRPRAGGAVGVVIATAGTRALGVDLGERRIGLALSDPSRTVASPHEVLRRSGDPVADRRAIVDARARRGRERDRRRPAVVAVGPDRPGRAAPRSPRSRRCSAIAGDIEVVAHDERLTTVTAERALERGAACAATRAGDVVDKVAAAVMLQSWLERAQPS